MLLLECISFMRVSRLEYEEEGPDGVDKVDLVDEEGKVGEYEEEGKDGVEAAKG